MTKHIQLSKLISSSLFYTNIIVVLFASIVVLADAVVFNESTPFRFVMLPASALGLFAVSVLLIGAAIKKRVLIYSGIVVVVLLVCASLFRYLPVTFFANVSWLSGQNSLPLWQSGVLILLCLSWLGRDKNKTLRGVSFFSVMQRLANLLAIVLCSMVVLAQGTEFSLFDVNTSLAAAAYMAFYVILLAIASICVPYVQWRYTTRYLSGSGWFMVSLIALSSIFVWFNYAYQLPSKISQSATEIATRMQQKVDEIVVEQRGLMNRLAERITAAEAELPASYYETEFKSYLRDFPYMDYLAVQGANDEILHANAQYPAELAWFNQYLLQQSVVSGFPPTNRTEPELTLHYDIAIDHAFIVISLPVNNRLGVRRLIAAVDFSRAMEEVISALVPPGYFVELLQPRQQSKIYDSVSAAADSVSAGSYQINLPAKLHWQLQVYTNQKTGLTTYLVTAVVILTAGWLTTLLVMLSQKLYQQSRRHRTRLLATNDKLRLNISELQRLQLQHQQIMSNSADMICVFNSEGRFVEVSASCEQILGYQADELVGKPYTNFVHPDDQAISKQTVLEIISGQQIVNFRNRYLCKDGKIVHLMWVANYVSSQDLLYAVARNFNDIVKAEQQLRLFKRAVDATANGVVIVDLTGYDQPIVYANAAFEKLTGYRAFEVIGKNCRLLQGAEPDLATNSLIRRAIAEREECSVVLKNYRKDQSLFWNQLYLAPVPDDNGQISHYIGIQSDITRHKRYEQELAYNASHDLLTGLPNRALLQDRLTQSYQISQRNQQKIALLFIDLDGFKLINDSLGHASGDEVLKLSCQRITSCIRPGDTLARIGGDEFVLMLTDLSAVEEVPPVTERILATIAKPMLIGGQELLITASIGISVSGNPLAEPMQLVQQADLAMYRAKQLGRNNFQWYSSELELASGKKLNLRVQLKKALANDEFELYYQPQIDAISGDVIGLEALLRWPHPDLGFVSPEEFIPLAEATGEIVPLSYWVQDKATRYNQSLIERGVASLVMAINVSSIQFARSNFVENLQQTLHESGLAPHWFEIELTESLLFENTEQVIYKLQQLRQLGVKISIDDFGTGYSSLSYLKRLPIDKLKIDRSFIREIVSDKRDAAISKAIISLAHHLGIKVIAEGVENEAQAALLRKNLCDEYQGFYFGKPMPAAELELYLQNYQQNRLIRPEINTAAKTILLVDDEENILSALTRLLRREGYKILSCTSAMRAFEVLALHQVQVIVSDQRMPGMSGTEFLSQVKDMYPDTIRMVLSGYTDLKSVTEAINKGAIYKFMTKPWQDEELRQAIKNAFLKHQQQATDKAEKL